MVSFVCDYCQETIKKHKLDQHTYKCPQAQFSCVDCSVTFTGTEYRNHSSCISEAEKYQKALYRPKHKNVANAPAPVSLIQQIEAKTHSLVDSEQVKTKKEATKGESPKIKAESKTEAKIKGESKTEAKIKESKTEAKIKESKTKAIKEWDEDQFKKTVTKILKKGTCSLSNLQSKVTKKMMKKGTSQDQVQQAFDNLQFQWSQQGLTISL